MKMNLNHTIIKIFERKSREVTGKSREVTGKSREITGKSRSITGNPETQTEIPFHFSQF